MFVAVTSDCFHVAESHKSICFLQLNTSESFSAYQSCLASNCLALPQPTAFIFFRGIYHIITKYRIGGEYMAILVQPGRFRYRVHSNGHGTRNTPKRNQHQTAYETWTESPAVHRIAIGKHGRPALGAKDRDRQITSVKQRRYSCNPGRGRNDADKGGSKMSAKKAHLAVRCVCESMSTA